MIKTWNLGYKKARKKAEKIYSKIETILCPALNSNITFSRWGFKHIVYKGRISRTKREQKKRFVLLQYAVQIIKNPQAIILYKEKEIEYKPNKVSQAKFWAFIEEVKSCKIKVVIIQIGNGNKKFCSIMGNNVKTSGRKKTTKNPPKK